jgi:hypothetical protein
MECYFGGIDVMSDTAKQGRRKPRQKQTYTHHKNAVDVTVYHPRGETIPAPVREEIENSVMNAALANGLLINIAYE